MGIVVPQRFRGESDGSGRQSRARGERGFTLLELLAVVSIVLLLLALLVPALRSVRGRARKLHCASNLRNISIDFQLFASGQSARGQGDSERFGPKRFRINDYLDSLYRLDEFWDLGEAQSGELRAAREVGLCPAAPSRLTKRKGFPCGHNALAPVEDVSLAFNMRLYRGLIDVAGTTMLAPVALTSVGVGVLDHPYVPLVMDVNGRAAAAAGLEPFYIAPRHAVSDDPYGTQRYWYPSNRHAGATNVAFVGGHVLASRRPHEEAWNWGYAADVGR